MKPHDRKLIEIVTEVLANREWPEPAEADEVFAEMILDALVKAGAMKARRGPEYWSDALQCWVTIPDNPA